SPGRWRSSTAPRPSTRSPPGSTPGAGPEPSTPARRSTRPRRRRARTGATSKPTWGSRVKSWSASALPPRCVAPSPPQAPSPARARGGPDVRVMLAAHHLPPDGGAGVERVVQTLARELVAAGDEVTAVSRRVGEKVDRLRTLHE